MNTEGSSPAVGCRHECMGGMGWYGGIVYHPEYHPALSPTALTCTPFLSLGTPPNIRAFGLGRIIVLSHPPCSSATIHPLLEQILLLSLSSSPGLAEGSPA